MVEITLQMPDRFATTSTRWLPIILELNLIPFQTPAATVANEIVRYLLDGPQAADVLAHQPSQMAQTRLQRLLALNQADMLNADEQRELDELEQIEYVMRMTKLRLMQQAE